MKENKINLEFDEVIGLLKQRELTKKEHDNIRESRRKLYEERTSDNKLDDLLTGFRFELRSYAEGGKTKEVILLGQFLNAFLSQIRIKKGQFAEYIDISPRNISKYLSGERKFNIDQALKLEKIFSVNAETLLEIQLKNDLRRAKNSCKGEYDKYKLKDLLPDKFSQSI